MVNVDPCPMPLKRRSAEPLGVSKVLLQILPPGDRAFQEKCRKFAAKYSEL